MRKGDRNDSSLEGKTLIRFGDEIIYMEKLILKNGKRKFQ